MMRSNFMLKTRDVAIAKFTKNLLLDDRMDMKISPVFQVNNSFHRKGLQRKQGSQFMMWACTRPIYPHPDLCHHGVLQACLIQDGLCLLPARGQLEIAKTLVAISQKSSAHTLGWKASRDHKF